MNVQRRTKGDGVSQCTSDPNYEMMYLTQDLPRNYGHPYAAYKLLYSPLMVVPEFPSHTSRVILGTWYCYWSGMGDLLPLTSWQARHHRSEIIALTGIDITRPPPSPKERLKALVRQLRPATQNEAHPGYMHLGATP